MDILSTRCLAPHEGLALGFHLVETDGTVAIDGLSLLVAAARIRFVVFNRGGLVEDVAELRAQQRQLVDIFVLGAEHAGHHINDMLTLVALHALGTVADGLLRDHYSVDIACRSRHLNCLLGHGGRAPADAREDIEALGRRAVVDFLEALRGFWTEPRNGLLAGL